MAETKKNTLKNTLREDKPEEKTGEKEKSRKVKTAEPESPRTPFMQRINNFFAFLQNALAWPRTPITPISPSHILLSPLWATVDATKSP